MIAWAQFAAAAPDLAAFGKQRLEKRIAYLATIRADGSPRVHPISPFIAEGRLFVYMEPTSPKGHDLRRDARYSMHCAVEDNSGGGGEFLIRGRGEEITDTESREMAFRQAEAIGYDPKERYALFELSIEEAMGTTYPEDQPKRIRWKAV
ncbi:MAG TPA: pyridoxamine 5'-phosphate oxidase family protein [Blastocatellia bacterium]|nr:pyridoxamine 5'-phosphate oxidase family protein [Blastocatellia bacterium]